MNSLIKQVIAITFVIITLCIGILYVGTTRIKFKSFPISWSFIAVGLVVFFGIFLISLILEEKETNKNDKIKNAIVATMLIVYVHILSVYIFNDVKTVETQEVQYIIGNFTNLFGIVVVSYFSASSVDTYINNKDGKKVSETQETEKAKKKDIIPDPHKIVVPVASKEEDEEILEKKHEERSDENYRMQTDDIKEKKTVKPKLSIDRVKSVNYKQGRKNFKPELIVCHITDGSYAGSVDWLTRKESGVSAHFVVARDGRITQLVDIADTAWANGTSVNSTSKLYYKNAINSTVRSKSTNANLYTISIEHEGKYSETHGALTEIQKQTTVLLIRFIQKIVKEKYHIDIPSSREGIIGHSEIHPITRANCPGELFPFGEIIDALKKT